MHEAIERFLKASRQPYLLEPGEELLPLKEGSFWIERKDSRLTIEAWSDKRNLSRRITGLGEQRRGRLELVVEHFARSVGRMFLIDMAQPDSRETSRRGGRLVFRERFRRFLTRQYPAWKLAEISAEQDLQHSLSPVFPRAFLRRGQSAVAAIAAAPDCLDSSLILSFGLIWLDYLRCEVFMYSAEDYAVRVDPGDYGNLDTKLEVFRHSPAEAQAWVDRLKALPRVECVENNNGSVSLRVLGVEFARTSGNELLFGLRKRAAAREWNIPEIERLAAELAALRLFSGGQLHLQDPEEWLAAQVRASLEVVDASLRAAPLYNQAPACLGGQRGLIDLLAVDYSGRLAVLELKASQDIHLPLQALDYWMRVKWHIDRDEFAAHGYFPGIVLRKQSPKLLLVSPALEFHPTTETILQFFSSAVEVERVGVGANWREKLRVMFRLRGAETP